MCHRWRIFAAQSHVKKSQIFLTICNIENYSSFVEYKYSSIAVFANYHEESCRDTKYIEQQKSSKQTSVDLMFVYIRMPTVLQEKFQGNKNYKPHLILM